MKKTSEIFGRFPEHRNTGPQNTLDVNKNFLTHWRLDEKFSENSARLLVFCSNGKSLGQMKNFLFDEKRIKILMLQLLPF